MSPKLSISLMAFLVLSLLMAAPGQAQEGRFYIVEQGDTIPLIAERHGLDVDLVATANGLAWNTQLYIGQRLMIPRATQAPNYNDLSTAPPSNAMSSRPVHMVQPGENLTRIAQQYGTTVETLRAINGLNGAMEIYSGQQLTIPWRTTANQPLDIEPVTVPGAEQSHGEILIQQEETGPSFITVHNLPQEDKEERWIYINLAEQQLTAYQGIHPVFVTQISGGLPQYPTATGDFEVYVKYEATRMRGGYGADYYDLSNVPHTMYFYQGYALHGAYWHNNFGTPMSHGCVNLALPDAEWLYSWASVGTRVVVR